MGKPFVVLFVALILLNLETASAERETGNIIGSVTQTDGMPLPDAKVTISSSSLIGGSLIAYCDTDGHYRFPGIGPGTYEVVAELDGFQTATVKDIRLFTENDLRFLSQFSDI